MRPLSHILFTITLLFLQTWADAQVQYPDNIVPADCSTQAVQQPWDAQVLNSVNDIHCYYVPLVGDIDGNGSVEIVAGKAITNDHYTTQLGIFRGSNLQQIGTINVSQKIYAGFTGPAAIVRYPNGNGGMQGAIILHCYDQKLRSYDINGNLLAISDVNTHCEGVISVTDFNGDGWPDLYLGNAVYDAATLTRLCSGPANGNMGRSWRNSNIEQGHCTMSFASDVLGDSKPELICGNTIYDVSIVSRTNVSLNSVTELKTITIPTRIPQDGNVAVADFNLDGQLDVMVIIDGTSSETMDSAYIYAYDPVSENILFTHGHKAKTIGYPLVGDIDGDGYLEFVYLDYMTPVSNSRITAMKFDPQTGLQTKWQAPHTDGSGQTSMTLFDFNQDNIMEIVYRDESNLRIINGSGTSHVTGNDTISFYNLYTMSMSAGTWKEYPVVADVNGDGAAEIVTCGKVGSGLGFVGGQLWVIGGIHPWAPARPVWNQYMYNVTNVNNDLTIPSPLFDNATAFTDPDGVVRRPFNNFLQQSTTLDQYGRPFLPLANVSATADTSTSFDNNGRTFTFRFCNTGSQVLSAPFHITYYADSLQGPIIQTVTVNSPLPAGDCMTFSLHLTENEMNAYPNLLVVMVALNDNGQGVAQSGGQQQECDTTDNYFAFSTYPCNIPTDTIHVDICMGETYSDDNFDITAAQTETEGRFFFSRTYPVGHCDSTIVLELGVHPSYHLHIIESILEESGYHDNGLDISSNELSGLERLDTTLSLLSLYGCDSIVEISLRIALQDLHLYLPNAITANGDGLNDEFFIPEKIQGQFEDFTINIYNRWGELCFYSNNKGFRWDGSVKGKIPRNVTYQYIIHCTNLMGRPLVFTGSITVL
ncbi:MAG: gliding motility-associated C-terminal domain-containing protein [Bacteroidales bacterium]|nr:gliding motility-associated C-terminal domain-containing protein [Bacteroidales bacterium]